MSTTKTTFAEIANSPELKKLVESSTMSVIFKSTMIANTMFGTIWAYAIGPLTFFTPASCRALHKELFVRECHNPRVDMEQRLRDVIEDHNLWNSISLEAGKPTKSSKMLAVELVRFLIDGSILHRRPFRVNQTNADALLTAMLLTLEREE